MHKDTKFCKSSFDISTFGFKAPPYSTVYIYYNFYHGRIEACHVSLVSCILCFLMQVIYKSGDGLKLGGGRVIKRDTASVEQPPHTEGCRLQSIAMHCSNALSPFFGEMFDFS